MIGVVLCGGESTRMGTDKGLLMTDGKAWVTSAVEKLSALEIKVFVSINQFQLLSYQTILPNNTQFIIDNASIQIKGPLLGLLSVHLSHPKEDIFILACDLLLMNTPPLKELYNEYYNNQTYDAYLFKNNLEYEPLCGIYKSKALATIYTKYQQGLLLKYSVKYALEQFTILSKPIKEQNLKYFKNFNSHAAQNGL